MHQPQKALFIISWCSLHRQQLLLLRAAIEIQAQKTESLLQISSQDRERNPFFAGMQEYKCFCRILSFAAFHVNIRTEEDRADAAGFLTQVSAPFLQDP